MRNPISAKVDFCNTSFAKCLFFQSQTPKFKLENHQKKQLGNRYEKIFFFLSKRCQKALKIGPRNQQKIDRIQAWTSQGPSLCPPMSQDRPRIVPGSSQGPPGRQSKVEAPSMPNDTHRHHKPKNWLQNCQKSSIQEPASQHTFQQRNSKNKRQTTKTYQASKPSNRSESKVLTQCVTQGML